MSGHHMKKKTKAHQRKGPIIIGVLLLIIIAAYGTGVFYFSSHFFPETKVADVDVSFLNESAAKNVVENTLNNDSFVIQARNGIEETIDINDLGTSWGLDTIIPGSLSAQEAWVWPLVFAGVSKADYAESEMYVDAEKLEATVSALSFMQEGAMEAPTDASTQYSDGAVVIIPETQGSTLDEAAVINAIKEALLSGADFINLEDAGCYSEPAVTQESLKNIVELENNALSSTITYKMDDDITYTIEPDIKWSWMRQDGDGIDFDTPAILSWLEQFYEDNLGDLDEMVYRGHDGEDHSIVVKGYDSEINYEAEAEQLTKDILSGQSVEREPIKNVTSASLTSQVHIEASIKDQHMWLYDADGSVIMETDIMTGYPIQARSTDPGIFSVLEKLSPTTLRGPKDPETEEYEWESPVTYWVRVTWSGIGFHDASWVSSFGGDNYLTHGSHGCINMPYDPAEFLYNHIEVGQPAFIYND